MNPSPIAQEFLRTGRCESCPVIDCHGHYGPYAGIWFPNVSAEAMIASMDRCGVRYVISSGHTAALVDTERGNAQLAAVIAQSNGRIKGYWAVNPNYPELAEQAPARFDRKAGFVGFKFLSDYHRYPITGEAYRPVLEFANSERLPVLMHTWGGSAYDSPALVEELAKRYPEAPLLMGHSGFGDWQTSIRVCREYPNVYLELTAAADVRGAVELMVEGGCAKRMLFGTDLPWFDPHYPIGAIVFSRISDDDRHDILHRNAERLFGA